MSLRTVRCLTNLTCIAHTAQASQPLLKKEKGVTVPGMYKGRECLRSFSYFKIIYTGLFVFFL